MVNEKQTKRERNIKSKLMAAIAMLLVSSIMMVSTTYAWFTLSTAPEVTGITTSIASNGNLEIALSPVDGQGASVGNASMNSVTDDWTVKNLTWGNLLDMSDEDYGLAALTLAPAQLAATAVEGGYTLNTGAVLGTPKYGSDGRISSLEKDAVIAHKNETGNYVGVTGTETFKYGVRAVGTSSGRSEQEVKLASAVSAIATNMNLAKTAAEESLSGNGDALTTMLMQKATADGAGTYDQHVTTLINLTSALKKVPARIDDALRSALVAAACTLEPEQYKLAIAAIEAEDADLGELVEDYGGELASYLGDIIEANALLAEDINDAYETAVELTGKTGVAWADVEPILTGLMNFSTAAGDKKITVNTMELAELKELAKDPFGNAGTLAGLYANTKIELNEGSGVYYDIAVITGNIKAPVPPTQISFEGQTANLENVSIVTGFTGTTQSSLLNAAAGGLSAPEAEGATQALDSFYGYVIDLMVRTNAANSNLLLQSDAAQRVYGESGNTETMGGGAAMIFKVTTDVVDNAETTDVNEATEDLEAKAAVISRLCNNIRVVLFDPTDNKIMGMAMVNGTSTTDSTITENDTEKPCKVITGKLVLCTMVESGNGMFVAGAAKESAVLCPLVQNEAKRVSVLVYLDGNNVTSADVLADENIVGALNLQFASDANLEPMMNSDLFNGTEPAVDPDTQG